MAAHAGEVSFPGGKVEAADHSPVETALREAEEEIGLARAHVEVLGFLDCYQIRSGFRVVPVVGLVTHRSHSTCTSAKCSTPSRCCLRS
jgi:8-oxo-dGTP pyrophosphatase MutT (NUDIX family)